MFCLFLFFIYFYMMMIMKLLKKSIAVRVTRITSQSTGLYHQDQIKGLYHSHNLTNSFYCDPNSQLQEKNSNVFIYLFLFPNFLWCSSLFDLILIFLFSFLFTILVLLKSKFRSTSVLFYSPTPHSQFSLVSHNIRYKRMSNIPLEVDLVCITLLDNACTPKHPGHTSNKKHAIRRG